MSVEGILWIKINVVKPKLYNSKTNGFSNVFLCSVNSNKKI